MPVARASSVRQPRYVPAARTASAAEVARDTSGDVVEGDDEESQASSSRHRKRSRRAASEEEEETSNIEDGEGQELNSNTLSPPKSQPLGGDASLTVKQAVKEWETAQDVIHNLTLFHREASVAYADNCTDPNTSKATLLDRDFREVLDLNVEAQIRQQALQDISNALARNEPVFDAVARYERSVQDGMQAYAQRTTRGKYLKNNEYQQYKEAIWEASHDEPMPALIDFIEPEQGDEENDDDEFTVGGMVTDYKCPITQLLLESPVTSTVCGHSYSKAAVIDYIEGCQNRRERAHCPRAGCDKALTKSALYDDKELESRARAYRRRTQRNDTARRTQASAVID